MSRAVTVHPTARVRGRVRLPGDKSLSHRYALLGALARGTTAISGYASGADCASTLACLRQLGVEIENDREPDGRRTVRVHGPWPRGLTVPAAALDAGNSGSTMRMLAGILAAQSFTTVIDGDASLGRRPMRRVIEPLARMGARIQSHDGRPPLTITGTTSLAPIDHEPDVPSAQVKSAVLLAGLHARGVTRVREPIRTRDHTERALRAFGAAVTADDDWIALEGPQALVPLVLDVPGDISSAAFWMVAAAALPGSDVTIEHVGLNPTRTPVIDVLRRLGARIDVSVAGEHAHEPVGTLRIRHGDLAAVTIAPTEVPAIIDELPVLAALAALGGELSVSGAGELRVKESDRISALAAGLRALGADIDEQPDGFHVRGSRRLSGGRADACGDHRLAMAFSIAALGATAPSTIEDAGAADVSYPEFFGTLDSLRA
ncbi:MAG: 3-phosphoshikimate 1-carboxyvinyltransferase [Acidimicrobiia bacterium]|nr:3-phosphoshikimate 1-carboxyvinyltransferase [Acidimicrobiia bacterium]